MRIQRSVWAAGRAYPVEMSTTQRILLHSSITRLSLNRPPLARGGKRFLPHNGAVFVSRGKGIGNAEPALFRKSKKNKGRKEIGA